MAETAPGSRRDWRLWYDAASGVLAGMNDSNMSLISAGVAFWGMLAIFPAVAAIIAIWGVFANPADVQSQLELLRGFVPGDAYRILDAQIRSLVSANSTTLGWTTIVSLGAAMWSSRAGVEALIRGLNAIYRERNRAGLRQMAAAFGVTFLLIAVALVALACVVVLPVMLAILPLGPITTLLVAGARWVVAIMVMLTALSVVYRYGPNRKRRRTGWLTPGAVVAVVIWAAISWAFSYYLSNFGNYNEVYGALGAVIALLMWLYFSAYSVLIGASLNVELETRTARHASPNPAPPSMQRDAGVAEESVGDQT